MKRPRPKWAAPPTPKISQGRRLHPAPGFGAVTRLQRFNLDPEYSLTSDRLLLSENSDVLRVRFECSSHLCFPAGLSRRCLIKSESTGSAKERNGHCQTTS